MKFRGLLIALLLVAIGSVSYRFGGSSAPASTLSLEETSTSASDFAKATSDKKAMADREEKEEIDSRTVIGSEAPDRVHVVVEIQQGTQSRYVFADGVLTLVEAPYHPLNLPGDYGVLPQTFGRGGEPLSAIILTTDPTPPGTLLIVKPIALFVADEGKIVRNTILAVPVSDIRYRGVQSISDLQQQDKDAVIAFLQDFRTIAGRPVVSVTSENAETAKGIIRMAMRAYERAYSRK
jgi:inorganic pyrophosphatase